MLRKLFVVGILLMSFGSSLQLSSLSAAVPGNQHFEKTWARTDKPVADSAVSRTWMWGPEAFTAQFWEFYDDSPNGQREVQYFDKSRMEISDPSADPNSSWYVTNGLLVVELVTGQMQKGNNSFVAKHPAEINIAGDTDDPNAPTYATVQSLLSRPPGSTFRPINEWVNRHGVTFPDPRYDAYNILAPVYIIETNHTIAQPFWDFMNSRGTVWQNDGYANGFLFESPFFATGFPITEPYWTRVRVGGTLLDVLVQCFERRCLTFTPANDSNWQVEAGNVGQHYYNWKYGQGTTPPAPTPPTTNPPDPTPPTPNPPTPNPPAPDPQPPVVDQLPPVILSWAWEHPFEALVAAITEVAGTTSGLLGDLMLTEANAYALAYMYNLHTADIGFWNHDTRGYYDWLLWYLRTWYGQGSRTGLYSHIRSQLYAGIYQPDSNVARRLVEVEREIDSINPTQGPLAYWFLLVNPARWTAQPELVIVAQEGYEREVISQFDSEYKEFIQAKNPGPFVGFGQFLAQRGYMTHGY